ncbi:MAG: HAMP domain-containing sensor histidine kinase [Collinsella sp.]|nr:HAMP domain-containing sensor histidine kinase [Collinsella sp.]
MSNGLIAASMLIVGLFSGALIAVATYATELHRVARFIDERSRGGSSPLTVGNRAPGIVELASAINDELDRNANARVEALRHQQEMQRDLAALSHDIRTPLMGAKGHLQLARDERDEAARERRVDTAIERIDATAALLDQLFSYTRASDPDLVIDLISVDPLPIVENVLLAHYPDFEERGWQPELEGTRKQHALMADPEALERIVENLVTNALRHGSGSPSIAVGEGGSITMTNPVADPEHIEVDRLFERFYRADGARGAGGTGLGLATAARLAEAQDLVLEARLEGDRLSFTLSSKSPCLR